MDGSKLVYRQITKWTFCCLRLMERRIYRFRDGFKWNRTKKWSLYSCLAMRQKTLFETFNKQRNQKENQKGKNYLI